MSAAIIDGKILAAQVKQEAAAAVRALQQWGKATPCLAVLLVGEDLDVLLELCDRILVLCAGRVSGVVDGRTATKEEVGLRMTNLQTETEVHA